MLIPGMTETMAQNVFQSGYGSFQSIAAASVEDVMAIPGYDAQEKAEKLIADAQSVIEKYKAEGLEIPKAPVKQVQKTETATGGDAKAAAGERLKAELAALDSHSASQDKAE